MTRNEFYFPSADRRTKIHAVEWLPEGEPKGVLQIAHGVTEHILCYEELAEYFTTKGLVVVGNDHLGHGTSVAEGAQPMYFGAEGSWFWVERDLYTCQKMMKKRYPDLPYLMLGLSMGAIVIRSFLIRFPGLVDGAVLAGTGQPSPFKLRMMRGIARLEARRKGEDKTTFLIKSLSIGAYNRPFKPAHSDCEWVCADEKALESFRDDGLRGREISSGMFREMLNGMIFTGGVQDEKKIDKELPVLLVSGSEDPIGKKGKGVKSTYKSLLKAGIKDVSMKLYPGMRNHIFREEGKEEVFGDIYQWMKDRGLVNPA